jgi:pSer/pThr/pTyr-binding forkhead associated (FHA) protein
MARLVVKSDGFAEQVIELHLRVNRLGRSPENDFPIEHPSVSAFHCEVLLDPDEIRVRDCDSTNGTFVGGEQVKEAKLHAGQTLCLGDVELFVESTDTTIAIPKFEAPRPAAPVVLSDGSVLCPRHPQARVTHQCTFCREVMCDACVHSMRRRGGKALKLCPLCSHQCEPLAREEKKKKSVLGFLQKTVKLPLLYGKKKKIQRDE